MALVVREYHKLGQELVDKQIISPQQLAETLRLQKERSLPFTDALFDAGVEKSDGLLAAIGVALRITVVNLKRQNIEPAVSRYMPEEVARRRRALPIELQGNSLLVAMADPEDLQAIEDLQAQTGLRIRPAFAFADDILNSIDLCYKATQQISQHLQDYPVELSASEERKTQDQADMLQQTPVVRTLELLLLQAARDRASDIHIEPQPDRLRIRYRIDGVLHEVVSLPIGIHAPLVSRIKILSRMNIAERRLPQDGQFSWSSPGKEMDIRVATIETAYGERAVMRLLDKSNTLINLPDLGFLPDILARYQTMLRSAHGMLLVSGPTGSGKTTTLYASLNAMDHKGRNIVTIEDPVEYKFVDINQIQVNAKANLHFADGLRALMRHDPDVILVGEIRDQDTARTAIQAALTGHLVLSSIHANDAEGVVYRLINLGVDPFLIASALIGVVAQRMVRRVCPTCAVEREASVEERLTYEREMGEAKTHFLRGTGCQYCANSGYRGRTGIFEVMAMSESIRRLILNNPEPGAITRQAMKEGMHALLRDGLIKAAQGITTPTEAVRNVFAMK